MDTDRADTLVRKVMDARRASTKATKAAERAAKRKKHLEEELFELIDSSPVKSYTAELGSGYGTVRIVPRETKFGQILDLDAAKAALEEAGYGPDQIIKTEVRMRQVNELVKDRLDNGQPLPEGIGWYPRRGVTLTVKK